jgi:hypothetical protein
VFNGFNRQVYVKVGPVQMVLSRSFNIEKVIDDRSTEPRKVIEWKKKLSIA